MSDDHIRAVMALADTYANAYSRALPPARAALESALREHAVILAATAEQAERERCAKLVDMPPGTEAWEVIGGEEGLTMLRELTAQIRKPTRDEKIAWRGVYEE